MANMLTKWMNREMWVLAVMLFVGLFWFALMSWGIPFVYEAISRFYNLDYSYLWNGVSERVRNSAPFGFLALGAFYVLFLAARFLKGLWRLIYEPPRPPVMPSGPLKGLFSREKLPVENVFVRECATAFIILGLCAGTLYVTRDHYFKMKKQYFSEIVSAKEGFQMLSDREKKQAIDQFDQLNPDVLIGGMVLDGKFHANAVYRLQHISFWMLIWGYPSVLVLRTIIWSMKVLRQEL